MSRAKTETVKAAMRLAVELLGVAEALQEAAEAGDLIAIATAASRVNPVPASLLAATCIRERG